MNNFFIDSHTHLDMKEFNLDRNFVIKRAKDVGVKYFLNIGYNFNSSFNSYKFSKEREEFFGAIGFHPHDAKDFNEKFLTKFESMLNDNKKIVAIGEIGLDFYRNLSSKETQIEVFKKQIEFAIEMNMPIIIHERESFSTVLEILKKFKGKVVGIFHCFNRDYYALKEILNLNFYIGIGGVLTYPKNNLLRETVKKAPIERILLETDAPYLPPQNKRGERNEPSYLIFTAQFLAKIHNITLENLAKITTKNFSELFKIQF